MDLIPDRDSIPVISRFRSSLAVKFTVLGLLILIVMAGVGGYMYTNTKESITTDTKQSLKETSGLQSNEISEWRKRIQQQVRGASSSNWMESTITAPPDVSHDQLKYRVEGNQTLVPESTTAIHVVYRSDSTEEVLYSSKKSYMNATLSDKVDYFAEHDVSTYVSGVTATQTFEHNGTSMMAFIAPVGTRRAAIFMIDLSRVNLSSLNGGDGETYVLNSDGTVIMSSDDSSLLSSASDVPGISSEHVSAVVSTDKTKAKVDSGKYVSGYASTSNGWVVVDRKPRADVFGLLNTFRQTFLVGFGALFGTLAIAIIVIRSVIVDLRLLSESTRRISNGEYDVEVSSSRSDEIGRIYEAFDDMTDEVKGRIEEARAAEREQREMNDRLESNVSQMGDVLTAVADGDLTVRMDFDIEHSQMKGLAEDFNDMMDSVQDAVEQFKLFGRDVATSSEEVTAGVDEVREASDEVTSSTQEISDGAVKQDEELDKTISELNDLTATIDEVAASSDQLAGRSQEAAERREDVLDAAEGASEAFDDIEDNTERAVDAVDSLQSGMDSISETVESISEVAEQTNMLAINASIEAARAGEAGEGFAVVADEVKELAEEAGKAAEDVEDSIETLKERTETTASDISSTMESVERGADTIDDALDELDEITSAVTDVNAGVQEIDDAAEKQAEMSQEVVNHIDDVANISAETASEAEDVASASEEQTASLTQVSKSVNDLAERAVKLNDKLEEFEVGLEGGVEMNRDEMKIDMGRFDDWDAPELSDADDPESGSDSSEGGDGDGGPEDLSGYDSESMETYDGSVDFSNGLDEALNELEEDADDDAGEDADDAEDDAEGVVDDGTDD